MSDVARVAVLLRACLEVLRDAGEPPHGKGALKRVAARVELTAYERELRRPFTTGTRLSTTPRCC